VSETAATAATFCATLVDEWVRAGVAHAVVAPGSRSTPLAIALASRSDIKLHVFHDERSASFAALGIGVATSRPAVLLCTSGTAAAQFHAAVVEAHQGEVPMIVCTADRPPELRDVGAPQSIDQSNLYGGSVRWFCDPGVPDAAMENSWRSIAARAVVESSGMRPGPIHLNVPFREPLVGEAGPVPPPRRAGPWHSDRRGLTALDEAQLAEVERFLDAGIGLIVAGHGAGDPEAVHALAGALGWPVLADARSGCRVVSETTIAAFDALLRHREFASQHRPEVVLRIGRPPASKVLGQWLSSLEAVTIVLQPNETWIDPDHAAALRLVADPASACRALAARVHPSSKVWLASWQKAEARAQQVFDLIERDSEPWIARTLTKGLPDDTTMVVSSSMPVRDVEWFGVVRDGLHVVANRGANGIDGVTSTAVGIALTGRPTALLIGDVAFLHDTNALIGLRQRDIDLSIVVVDNDGGGIFEFLPQASSLDRQRFEQLFGTPHGVDIEALAAAHGVPVVSFDDAMIAKGLTLTRLQTDRRRNVVVHDDINAAVTAQLS
jgi:2-succinyl-5-enolpyruvyl-6-hydroxy-3-cyclohexene-1-carboxylate synthase